VSVDKRFIVCLVAVACAVGPLVLTTGCSKKTDSPAPVADSSSGEVVNMGGGVQAQKHQSPKERSKDK